MRMLQPWRALEKERGPTIRLVRMQPETGQLDWQHFSEQLSARTKLVAVGAASNALGTITDVRRAAELAHALGVQASSMRCIFAPHQLVDVRGLDCDFLACSAYKFYGPHIGILYGRQELLAALDFPKLEPAPNDAPERGVETGTQNHEGIAGTGPRSIFLHHWSREKHGGNGWPRLTLALRNMAANSLGNYGTGWGNPGSVSFMARRLTNLGRRHRGVFTVNKIPSGVVASPPRGEGNLLVSDGDFYAATVVERLGLSDQGLVRAGCACYTTVEEVERLVDGVREIARR